jgi:hypothetical protein
VLVNTAEEVAEGVAEVAGAAAEGVVAAGGEVAEEEGTLGATEVTRRRTSLWAGEVPCKHSVCTLSSFVSLLPPLSGSVCSIFISTPCTFSRSYFYLCNAKKLFAL